ncbi:MAG: cyclodeaminase/cyclohydrolase family protein, partial [Thermoplasmata archaeon]
VLSYSIDPKAPAADLAEIRGRLASARGRFLELSDLDSRSYESVRTARRALREHPEDPSVRPAYLAALEGASSVPLETARAASELGTALAAIRGRTKAALGSDLVTALALFRAAIEGALANVAINLDDLRAAGVSTEAMDREIERLRPAA